LIKEESAKMVKTNKRTLRQLFLTILGTLAVLVFILILFERKIQQLIESYMESMEQDKQKLQEAYSRIEELAYTDSLTGLLNRRAIYPYLRDEQARFERNGAGFGILMCDIDWFKSINDNYGHQAGDYILKEISQVMLSNLRVEDKVCRWGGEEFICLITNAEHKPVEEVAEKLRKSVEGKNFSRQGKKISVTITIGVAVSQQDKTIEDLINLADERLYQGKQQGRNRTVGPEDL